jgi:hypothetical protein
LVVRVINASPAVGLAKGSSQAASKKNITGTAMQRIKSALYDISNPDEDENGAAFKKPPRIVSPLSIVGA